MCIYQREEIGKNLTVMNEMTGFNIMRIRLSTETVYRQKVGPGPNPKKFHHFRVELTCRH